ncbi:MAG: MFS transporter [Candidatus Binataceae bacterium]
MRNPINDHDNPSVQPLEATASARSLRALDLVNFFQADVQTGVGPYLAIYLLASLHWSLGRIGIAMGAQGIATVLAQTPVGALVDATRRKRALMAAAALALAVGCLAIGTQSGMAIVVGSQVWIGVAAVVFGPAIAAVSLGLVGRARFSRRVGRNDAYNHAGNVFGAAMAGLAGHFISYAAIFYASAVMSLATVASALSIREREIDHDLARQAPPGAGGKAHFAGMRELVADHRLMIFAGAVILFHFANAAMLPLVGELLSSARHASPALDMSACIIVAQIVMIPIALLAGRYANRWGRKPILMIGFAALPLRGILFTVTRDAYALISIQALDGVGAGIFGVIWVIIVADLAQGTGRFNLIQGAISTGVAIGASLSNVMTGFVVEHAGYNAGFLILAAIALAALAVLGLAMPETMTARTPSGETQRSLTAQSETGGSGQGLSD